MRFLFAIFFALSGCATPEFMNSLNPRQQPYFDPDAGRETQSINGLTTAPPQISESVGPQEKKKFQKAFCKKMNSAKCADAFYEMVVAKFRIAYPSVRADEYNLWCKANPFECSDVIQVEKYFQITQQAKQEAVEKTVDAEEKRRWREAVEKNERENADRRRAAVKAMADSFRANQPVTCTTNHFGDTSTTSCR